MASRPLLLGVLVAVIVGVATVAVLLWRARRETGSAGAGAGSRNTVLLLGPPGSGKTALFHALLESEKRRGAGGDGAPQLLVATFPSLRPNVARCGAATLADLPGDLRLTRFRDEALAAKPAPRAAVLLVDARDRGSVRNAASVLYDLLTAPELAAAPVLVFANEKGPGKPMAEAAVELELARQIQRLRSSRTAALEGEDAAARMLGVEGQVFSFADLPNAVTFAAGSVARGEIAPVVDFVQNAGL